MLLPRKPVPELDVALTNGGTWTLSEEAGENFTMIVVYRGLHCPICKSYLQALQEHLPKLRDQGVNVVAISSDTEERAKSAQSEWGVDKVTIGYDWSIEEARKWGLYVSSGISDKEPDQFIEPGLFLIRPDGTLYFASIQTMPFARPTFDDVVGALDFVLKKDYPARGELAG